MIAQYIMSTLILLKKMSQSVAGSQRSASTIASYEDTIRALNTLQSNAAYLQATTKYDSKPIGKLQKTEKYLLRSGVTWNELDSLSVIHVAGTKGKGSTCAFTEAILRHHGFRTGFYSSPHLVSVRERLRIDGVPITEQNFIKHFWRVYDRLEAQKENETDMPPFFAFLTILMFNVFLDACIDVAVIEVGIGGELDSTNVIRNPVCVGISSLGLDHTSLLGDTLELIASQKSGIFKRNALAFTVPQPDNALNVLKRRAVERCCRLTVVPDFSSYDWNGAMPILGIGSRVTEVNASLAIQLADAWMEQRKIRKKNLHTSNGININETHAILVIDLKRNVSDNENDDFIKTSNLSKSVTDVNFREKLPNSLGKVIITNDNCAEKSKYHHESEKNGISTPPSAAYSSGRTIKFDESNSDRKFIPNADFPGNFGYSPHRDMNSNKSPNETSVENSTTDDFTNGLNIIGFGKSTFSILSLEKTASALSSCRWPGRFQVLQGSTIDFYIDGAHTIESIDVCASWYLDVTKDTKGKRFLIFNTTGDRDSVKLLEHLSGLNFTRAYFVPNVAGKSLTSSAENVIFTKNLHMSRCQLHCSIWGEGAVMLNSVNEALNDISLQRNLLNGNILEGVRPQVLITGSLHLVGAAMEILDPELSMMTNY